jgi:ribosomal protein L11 methyltransferase
LDSSNPLQPAWFRLTLTSFPQYLDDLGELLEKFDALSISFTPATSEPIFGDESETDRFWEQTAVSALFGQDIDMDILIACIRNKISTENIIDCRIEAVHDTNWLENHKPGFTPMVFGDKLCICPSWLPRPHGIEHIIELDPGLAFGTGTHATTSLCLQWLADNDLQGIRVIDYGCGSGILGLAAAKLGASSVEAVDIDPQALLATISNARINHLEARISTALPADFHAQAADVLLANILLNPLIKLAGALSALVKDGGRIVLSGVLSTQMDSCLQVYSEWFDMDTPVFRDEWVMLTGTRRLTPQV